MKLKTLLPIYLIALFIEFFANAFGLILIQYVSKPSLMILLLIYFVSNSGKFPGEKNWVIFALVFSWFGDVFLLIDKYYGQLFIYGLIAFLIAHIFYTVYFLKIRKKNLRSLKFRIVPVLFVAAYSLAFFLFLLPNLSELKIPVFIYISVISLMLIAGLHSFDREKQAFGWISIVGIMLFILSDSLLAVNRFVVHIPLASSFVMLTYALAQLLITYGALMNLRHLHLK